jgi:hypothetical protein
MVDPTKESYYINQDELPPNQWKHNHHHDIIRQTRMVCTSTTASLRQPGAIELKTLAFDTT